MVKEVIFLALFLLLVIQCKTVFSRGFPDRVSIHVNSERDPIAMATYGEWITIMYRHDGELDFNYDWKDYRDGFGYIRNAGEYWLGNERVYQLTNKSGDAYSLLISLFLYTSGDWYYAYYNTFSLESESDQYAIHLSGFSGNASDSLTNTSVGSKLYHGGMKFTTWSNDNDGKPTDNCAQEYSAGWWFNDCWYACLTCPYGSTFAWKSLAHVEPEGRLQRAEMLIRRK